MNVTKSILPNTNGSETIMPNINKKQSKLRSNLTYIKKNYHTFDPIKNLVSFDRIYSERLSDTLHKREMNVRNQNGKVKLRLIIDKYSAEIFVNNGEKVMTSNFYTDLDATDISFYAKGNATINIEKHDIAVK